MTVIVARPFWARNMDLTDYTALQGRSTICGSLAKFGISKERTAHSWYLLWVAFSQTFPWRFAPNIHSAQSVDRDVDYEEI